MKKLNKLIVLVLAIVMITAAFAPAALAASAPSSWSSWPNQRRYKNGNPSQGAGYSTTYCFALQNVLKANYHLNDSTFKVDGAWGNATDEAVYRFQQDHYLTADYIVGANTWTKMYSYLRKNSSSSFYEPSLDRYTNYYGIYNKAQTSYSADWFRDINFAGPKTWATNRDGSRGTWYNITD